MMPDEVKYLFLSLNKLVTCSYRSYAPKKICAAFISNQCNFFNFNVNGGQRPVCDGVFTHVRNLNSLQM